MRKLLCVLAIFMGLGMADAATLVLVGGKRVEYKSAWVQGSNFVVRTLKGPVLSYPVSAIDFKQTFEANGLEWPPRRAAEARADQNPNAEALSSAGETEAAKAVKRLDKEAGVLNLQRPLDEQVTKTGPRVSDGVAGTIVFRGKMASLATIPDETLQTQRAAAVEFERAVRDLMISHAPALRAFEKYRASCVGKTTTVENYESVSGGEHGGGGFSGELLDTEGVAVPFFGGFGWTSSWYEDHSWTQKVDNETTPFCRSIHAEITPELEAFLADRARIVAAGHRSQLRNVDEETILAKYGLR